MARMELYAGLSNGNRAAKKRFMDDSCSAWWVGAEKKLWGCR